MSQSNSSLAGVYLAGRLVGIRQDSRPGKDNQPWIRHFIGVEVDVVNGFPGQKDVIEVQVSDQNNNAALHTALEKYTNKDVLVSMYVRTFATRGGGAGFQYSLSSDQNNILPQSQTIAKVA